jgi:folate-dependent tRNA-U54 methylase TrmFO/GidA
MGNSIRYVGMSPRNDALKVDGVENLFCAGEKAGLLVGHTEAIVTGTLAGCNAVRHLRREPSVTLPDSLAAGDAIGYVGTQMTTEEGLGFKYTFSGSVYFDRMKAKGLYSIDREEIRRKVERVGMTGIFS